MLKVTMPIYTVTFPQDFLKVIFQQAPLASFIRIAYEQGLVTLVYVLGCM